MKFDSARSVVLRGHTDALQDAGNAKLTKQSGGVSQILKNTKHSASATLHPNSSAILCGKRKGNRRSVNAIPKPTEPNGRSAKKRYGLATLQNNNLKNYMRSPMGFALTADLKLMLGAFRMIQEDLTTLSHSREAGHIQFQIFKSAASGAM